MNLTTNLSAPLMELRHDPGRADGRNQSLTVKSLSGFGIVGTTPLAGLERQRLSQYSCHPEGIPIKNRFNSPLITAVRRCTGELLLGGLRVLAAGVVMSASRNWLCACALCGNKSSPQRTQGSKKLFWQDQTSRCRQPAQVGREAGT